MNTGFKSVHPFPCFFYYAGVTLLCMLFSHPLYLLSALIAVILLNLFHDAGRQLRRWLPFYVLIGALVLLVNPLFSHRGSHILFYFWDNPITLESIAYGFAMMLSIVTILIAFVSYNHVLTPPRFLFLFYSVSPKAALLLMMAVRFVPLLRRRLRQISMVQRTRGVYPLQGSLRKRLGDGMKQMQILLTWSLEEALQTADSMAARGYGTVAKRSAYVRYSMTRRDWIYLSIMGLSVLVCVSGWILGHGKWTIYPELERVGIEGWEWISLSSLSMFMFIPVWIEGREKIRWHSWK